MVQPCIKSPAPFCTNSPARLCTTLHQKHVFLCIVFIFNSIFFIPFLKKLCSFFMLVFFSVLCYHKFLSGLLFVLFVLFCFLFSYIYMCTYYSILFHIIKHYHSRSSDGNILRAELRNMLRAKLKNILRAELKNILRAELRNILRAEFINIKGRAQAGVH